MPTRRCVEVDLGSLELTALGDVANRIINQGDLGWEYGGVRGSARYRIHREFDTDADFDQALGQLHEVVGEGSAREVPC